MIQFEVRLMEFPSIFVSRHFFFFLLNILWLYYLVLTLHHFDQQLETIHVGPFHPKKRLKNKFYEATQKFRELNINFIIFQEIKKSRKQSKRGAIHATPELYFSKRPFNSLLLLLLPRRHSRRPSNKLLLSFLARFLSNYHLAANSFVFILFFSFF